jgi:hypothetical protein
MTTIIVKPARENSKSRRYRQRGEHMRALKAECDADRHFAKRIDKAFKKLSEGCSESVARATSLGGLRDTDSNGSCCLPDVAKFAAGHRNNKQVTAR